MPLRLLSLQELTLKKIIIELESPRSGLFGEHLPGILHAVLLPDLVIAQLWEAVAENHGLLLTRIRPFFRSECITKLSLCKVSNELAREICPLPLSCVESDSVE